MSREPPIQLSLWPLVLVAVEMQHEKIAKEDKRYHVSKLKKPVVPSIRFVIIRDFISGIVSGMTNHVNEQCDMKKTDCEGMEVTKKKRKSFY
jgi:hypothetical protein